MSPQLTERQRAIKERLARGMGAREIAEDLGITRNAVYQQIQRMRKYGELDATFTPSGQPPREQLPGSEVLSRLLGTDSLPSDGEALASQANAVALLYELKYTRDQLVAIVGRLSEFLPR